MASCLKLASGPTNIVRQIRSTGQNLLAHSLANDLAGFSGMLGIDHVVFHIDDDRRYTTDPADFASQRRFDGVFTRPSPGTVTRDRFGCGELPGFDHGSSFGGFFGPPLRTSSE